MDTAGILLMEGNRMLLTFSEEIRAEHSIENLINWSSKGYWPPGHHEKQN